MGRTGRCPQLTGWLAVSFHSGPRAQPADTDCRHSCGTATTNQKRAPVATYLQNHPAPDLSHATVELLRRYVDGVEAPAGLASKVTGSGL